MSRIIDFHSHVLPGIDDGSKSVEQSLAMLKMESEQGIARVIATPHFYAHHDSPEHFLAARAAAQAALTQALPQSPRLPRVDVGAEVYYFHGISDTEILPALRMAGSNYVMIEMPVSSWTERMLRELEEIRSKQALIPIVAHIDRYIAPLRTRHIPERLAELPVLVQANADFFLRRSTRPLALRLLWQGKIHLLGSDCHNLTDRAPNLGGAVDIIRKNLGKEAIDRIVSFQQEVLQES